MKVLLDGQRYYIGKPLALAHENLGITNAAFDEMREVLSNCLKLMGPDVEVYREILKRVNSLRPMIVQNKSDD